MRELLRLHNAGDSAAGERQIQGPVSYTHLRAHETVLDLVCRLLLEKKKEKPLHHAAPLVDPASHARNLR